MAPERRWPALGSQHWRHVAFLHWEVDADAAAALLPARTRPDLFEGRTYVGLVPLRMCSVRAPTWGPVVVPDFWETNVRLYSVDDEGRHGVVFLSLDAERLSAVLAARAGLSLPYVWSRMSGRVDDGVRGWALRRRGQALRGPGARGPGASGPGASGRALVRVREGERV